MSHHLDRSWSASPHGSVTAAVTTAVTASSSSWLTKAATIERRVMPWRRDSDIWATTGHTLPGMYLPS